MRPCVSLYVLCIALFGIAITGCVSQRYGAIALVDDVGADLSTRYRYRIVRSDNGDDHVFKHSVVNSAWLKKHGGVFGNEVLVRELPNVFSADGIAFTIRLCDYNQVVKYQWSQVFAGLSGGLCPQFDRKEHWHSYEIKMQNERKICSSFDIVLFSEFAASWFPTSFLAFSGVPDVDGNRLYCQSEKLVGMSCLKESCESNPTIQDELLSARKKAFAYAIAKRLKEMEDSGAIDAMLRKREAERAKAPPHRVERLSRDLAKGFAYDFTLELQSVPSNPNESVQAVMLDFSKSIVEDYADTFPHAKKEFLRVAFSDVAISGVKISGKASVLTITPLSLTYDANTRQGKLSVRYNSGQVAEARKWILENLETLARDKNIMLTTGTLPPQGEFLIRNETADGNKLEIEFKTE